MTVSVTKNLAPHVQTLADFREAEKLAAAEVERCKGELKTAKAIWEERVADLNRAVDDLIDKEREPTLFDSVEGSEGGGDASGDGGANPDPSGTPPGGGGNGEVMDAEVVTTIVPTGLAPSDPVPLSLPAAAADVATGEASTAEPPTWHRMTLTEAFEAEVDIPVKVLDTLKAAGVETCGVLAAKLVEGESFGLEKLDVEHLCRGIEQMSEDDENPIVLTKEADEADDEGEGRSPSTAARWEAMFARNPGAYTTPSDLRRRQLIADFRTREAAAASVGEQPVPKWGLWSEFTVKLASGDVVNVCYEPGEVKGDDAIGYFADHFEFIGEATSHTGYRSHYQNFDKKHPRPGDVSLAEWAREFVESLYVERELEKKKRAPRGEGKKSGGKSPKGKGGKKVAA